MSSSINAQQIESQLRGDLGIAPDLPIIAHVNLTAIGMVEGGEKAVKNAVLAAGGTVVMPAFTYQTQIIPHIGPPDNALNYGSNDHVNAKAEIFRPDMPVHPDCGVVAEVLRRDPAVLRSTHPILSFVAHGPGARDALASQTLHNPLGPIAWLEAHRGAVLLMGVDQRQNFSLHLAEQRAGRKAFVRWALTLDDIEELPNIPGCMEGFNAVWGGLLGFTRVTWIGMARCELIPLREMLAFVEERLRIEPNFMLCDKPSCLSCRAREQ